MHDVALSELPSGPLLVRTFAACLAAAAEVDADDLPDGGPDLPAALGAWRSWLAGRGAGLVPIKDAARFHWPGYWVAVLGESSSAAVLMFGTPAGVVLSPHEPALLGRAAVDLDVRRGYLLASMEAALGRTAPVREQRGHVVAIAVVAHANEPMRAVEHARALAGRGLEGDRYAAKAGSFTPADPARRGYDLTLIEAEALDQLTLPDGNHLEYADARRNVVTRGIDLNALVGRVFRIGDVTCRGQRGCEPCALLERLTTRGVLRGLIHRGGLRADVLTDGEITVGSVVATID